MAQWNERNGDFPNQREVKTYSCIAMLPSRSELQGLTGNERIDSNQTMESILLRESGGNPGGFRTKRVLLGLEVEF